MKFRRTAYFLLLTGLLLAGTATALSGADKAQAGAELPRGTLVFEKTGMNSMTHWDEYSWEFEAIRWGRYRVEVDYHGLRRAMGVQARLRESEARAKGFLKPGGTPDSPRTGSLGEIYIPAHGVHELVLFTPQDDPIYDFKLSALRLLPAPEGEPIVQADDGGVTLLAKNAITFSEKMRYEPKEEKNCLGFWIFKDDWAQWEFEVKAPGEFAVTVYQGCGKGNHGSEVAVELGDQRKTFVVKDTGGFQNWEPVELGQMKIDRAGKHRLSIKPVTQAGKAVMDIQKILLRRIGD